MAHHLGELVFVVSKASFEKRQQCMKLARSRELGSCGRFSSFITYIFSPPIYQQQDQIGHVVALLVGLQFAIKAKGARGEEVDLHSKMNFGAHDKKVYYEIVRGVCSRSIPTPPLVAVS